jgi:4'-phosphopantetheinyl transferase
MGRVDEGAVGSRAVDVWVRPVGPDVDRSCLDDVELARLATFRDSAQARSYAAGHVLARSALAGLLGVPPADLRFDRTCPTCGAQHGRPLLEGAVLHLSLTRTASTVAVATSESAPVGVDVEVISGTDFPGFADTALHPDERAAVEVADRPTRLRQRAVAWARKEAALKAAGVGLAVDPASMRTPESGIRTRLVALGVDVTVVDLALDVPGVVGAVALLGPGGPLSVRWR